MIASIKRCSQEINGKDAFDCVENRYIERYRSQEKVIEIGEEKSDHSSESGVALKRLSLKTTPSKDDINETKIR